MFSPIFPLVAIAYLFVFALTVAVEVVKLILNIYLAICEFIGVETVNAFNYITRRPQTA